MAKYIFKRKTFAFGLNNLSQAFSGMSNASRNAANIAKQNALKKGVSEGLTGSALAQKGQSAFDAAKKVDLNAKDRLKAGAKGLAGLAGGGALVVGGAGLALGASDG